MKTIEQRAEYLAGYVLENVDPADALLFRKLIVESYMAGAEEERKELTRWHDPSEPPQDQKHKLIKLDDCGYTLFTTGQWCPDSKRWWGAEINENSKVIGWREIH